MKNLGAALRVKFDIVLKALKPLGELGIAEWTEPKGGYFVSLDVLPGTAKRVYELMKGAGVVLTQVGATFPYGKDPEDKNLRLAPSYPSCEELALASEILVCVIKLATLEKMLNK
jgi:DNA-binding transcriptional MocR family regulator